MAGDVAADNAIAAWVNQASLDVPGQSYLEDARSDATITFGGLNRLTASTSKALGLLGLPPGAPVAVKVEQTLGYAACFLAIVAAGFTAVPIAPEAPAPEEDRVRRLTGPLATVLGTDGDGSVDIKAEPEGTGRLGWKPGPAGGVLLCTSGTTGSPKVVYLSPPQVAHVASNIARHHGLGPGERGLSPLPLFHVNAEVVGLMATLAARATLVLDDRFHRTGFWEMVENRGITWVNAVPAIITLLATTGPPPGPLRRARFVRSASAPLPAATLLQFEAVTGVPVIESYGMTEAASMITANPLGAGLRRPGSAGVPVGSELKVVDEAGAPRPSGQVGRVLVRGPGIITSYALGGAPDAFDPEGWLDTKDLGYQDEDGFLYLVGRADDIINRGGENIYPREVEEVLLADPRVAQAAVVGAPDPVLGAKPVAYVVPATPGDETDGGLGEELLGRCRSELMAFKVPVQVIVVAALPTGPSGKISRQRTRQLLASSGAPS